MRRLLVALGLLLALAVSPAWAQDVPFGQSVPGAPAATLVYGVQAPGCDPSATLQLGFTTNSGSGLYCLKGTRYGRFLDIPGASFTRASNKTELTAANQVIVFAPGVPAITDLGFLPEGAITQSLFNSTFGSISAGAPAAWTANAGGGTGVTSLYGSDSAAMTFTASASRPFIAQTISVSASTTYTLSVLVEANPNGLPANELLAPASVPAGTTTNYPNGAASVPAAGTWVSATITVSTTAGSIAFRTGVGTSSNQTGTATLSRPQFEANAARSSYVPNASQVAVATRAADVASIGGLTFPVTGTVLADYVMPKQPAASRGYVWDVTDTGNSRFTERGADVGDPQPSVALGNGTAVVSLSPYTGVTGQTIKTAFAYDTTAARAGFSANGTDTTSATQAVAATLTGATLGLGNSSGSINQLNGYLKRFVIMPSFYSSAQRIAATQ